MTNDGNWQARIVCGRPEILETVVTSCEYDHEGQVSQGKKSDLEEQAAYKPPSLNQNSRGGRRATVGGRVLCRHWTQCHWQSISGREAASGRESMFKLDKVASNFYGEDLGASSIGRNPENSVEASENRVGGMAWEDWATGREEELPSVRTGW